MRLQAAEQGGEVLLDESGSPMLDASVDAPKPVDQATIEAMKAEIEGQLKAELATRQSFLAGGVVSVPALAGSGRGGGRGPRPLPGRRCGGSALT
jgi:hypothetical protein